MNQESQAIQFKQLVDALGIADAMLRMVVGMIALRFKRDESIVVREFLRLTRVLKGAPGAQSDPLTAFGMYAKNLGEAVVGLRRNADGMAAEAATNPDVQFVRDELLAKAQALEECHAGIIAILDRYPTPLPPTG